MKKLWSLLSVVLFSYMVGETQSLPVVYKTTNAADLEQLPDNVIELTSVESEQMVVSISFDKKYWKKFILFKNQPLFVDLQKNEQAVLRVCTYGVDDCLLHDIFGASDYETFWNDRIQMWDLNIVNKRIVEDIYNLPPEFKKEDIVKENKPKEVKKPLADVVKDRDGNEYPFKKLADGKNWLTKNLNVKIPGSYIYMNKLYFSENYGRLYTWQAAKKACASLGDGWRLPSDEEWANLVKQFDSSAKAMYQSSNAFKSMSEEGDSGFKALLAGLRYSDGSFYFQDKTAFFWTSTQSNSVHAWYYYFDGRQGLMRRKDYEKTRAYSCRCIQD